MPLPVAPPTIPTASKPSTRRSGRDEAAAATVYVVDPNTGEVVFACKQFPPQSLRQQQKSLAKAVARAAKPGRGRLAPIPSGDSHPRLEPSKKKPVVRPILNPANGHYEAL